MTRSFLDQVNETPVTYAVLVVYLTIAVPTKNGTSRTELTPRHPAPWTGLRAVPDGATPTGCVATL